VSVFAFQRQILSAISGTDLLFDSMVSSGDTTAAALFACQKRQKKKTLRPHGTFAF
jgi:hypothetical protein